MKITQLVRGVFSLAVIVGCIGQYELAVSDDARPGGSTARGTNSATSSVPIFNQIVVFNLPAGWKPGHENTSQGSYILEFLPKDQTVQAWTEMITVQGFRNLAQNPKATPSTFLSVIAGGLKMTCGEEFIAQSLGDRKIDSYEAHAAIIGCPRLQIDASGAKAGQGEIAYYLAIKGTNDLYVLHRAVRGDAFRKADAPISSTNAEEFMRALQPIKICDRAEPKDQCWARPPR